MLLLFTFIVYTLQVILYVNDTYQQSLTELFGYLENPTYSAVTGGFTIIPQYQQYTDQKKHNQNADIIITAKAQHKQGHWTNHFLFIENNKGTYNLHYSENLQEENVATPQFNEHLEITKNGDICYDGEQYDQNHYIIDCAQIIDQQPQQNKLYVLTKDATIKIYNVNNPYNYVNIKKRKLSILQQEFQSYLLQGTLQETESIIQIYKINSADITFEEQENEINSRILIILLQLSSTFKFYLIDYKLVYDQIFILDKTFVASISFDNSGDWQTNLNIPISGNIIAFDYVYFLDVNGQQNKILVVLKDKTFDLYYNDQSVATYALIKTVSANSQIKISHQYIIVEDENTIYQYTIKTNVLLSQKTLQQINFYLINPIYPDLISISYNMTRRYFISEGYFQVQSQQVVQPNNLYISATTKSATKYAEIYCQIIEANDEQLYPNGKPQQIITDVLYKVNQTQDIVQFVSGPNIDYSFEPDDELDLEFENVQQMNIQEWPSASNIYFQDMLQFNDTLVYVLFQLKDLSVEFYQCAQNTFSLVEKCTLSFKTNNFPIQTNALHFQWWIENNQAYMAFCSSTYTVELWKLDAEQLTKIKAITYLYPITQILELKGILYILVEQQKKIGVYNSLDGQFLDSIDEALIKSLGLLKSWSPKKIFGNQKYQSHLLFIKNSDNLLITIYNKQINLVECILITEDIQVTVSQQSFFLIKVNSTSSVLQEYSIRDLNNIYLMRNLQLYGHEFYSPLQITQSEDNGFLFILTKQKQILLYQPFTENSNDQLFRIFDVAYTDSLIMSASGYKKTHFYFSNGQQHYYYAFLMQTKIYIKSINLQLPDYYISKVKTLIVQNAQHSKRYAETLKFLNTKYPLKIESTNISLQASTGELYYELNNTVFGSIETYKFNNIDTTTKNILQLITPIQKQSENIIQKVIDIEYYNQDYRVAIGKDQLYIINNQDNGTSVIDFHQPNSCEYLAVQEDSSYIITLCNYNNKYHAYLVTCSKSMQCQIFETPKDLLDLQGVQKMLLIRDNLLLIQDFGKIYVFLIKRETDTWSIVLTQIIDNQKSMTDFIVQEYSSQNYILSFIDQADYLNVYYAEFQLSKLNILSQDQVLIYDVVLNNSQFAFPTTDYIQLLPLSKISNDKLNYLIISNDVASFAVEIELIAGKKIDKSKIKAVFNPYQDWKAINKAHATGNYVFIPYTNKERIVLSYYNLEKPNLSQNMIQGLNEQAFSVTDGAFIAFSYYDSNGTAKLYCNINKTLDTYQVREYPNLFLNNSNQLQKNTEILLQITVNNPNYGEFNNLSLSLSPIPTPPPGPTPDDKSGSKWWWITLIVLGSVGILGGLGYFIWKKRQQKVVLDHYSLNRV